MKTDSVLANQLTAARARQGLSQVALAAKAGLPPSAISHFESGRRSPSVETLCKLAEALAVSSDFLLGRAQETQNMGQELRELVHYGKRMSIDDLCIVVDFAEFLANRQASKMKRSA